jgi:hypothetical protein
MTCEEKGKTNEASMLRIIQNTLPGRLKFEKGQRALYLVDGAPSHMHASVATALGKAGFRLYISPPDSTPFAQACDKTQVNKAFQKKMVELYTNWIDSQITEEMLDSTGPLKLDTPSRKLFGTWVRDAWLSIQDQSLADAMYSAQCPLSLGNSMGGFARHQCCKGSFAMAYFPNGMAYSDLLDSEQGRFPCSRVLASPHSRPGNGNLAPPDSRRSVGQRHLCPTPCQPTVPCVTRYPSPPRTRVERGGTGWGHPRVLRPWFQRGSSVYPPLPPPFVPVPACRGLILGFIVLFGGVGICG